MLFRLVRKTFSNTTGPSYEFVSSNEIDLAQLTINDDATPFSLYFMTNMSGSDKVVVNLMVKVSLVSDDEK